MKNCRMRKVPNALKMPGTMSACSVFSQPSDWMISYCGSRNSCDGTMSTERKRTNSDVATAERDARERVAGHRAEHDLADACGRS